MKNFLKLAIYTIFFSFLLSCKRDDNPPINNEQKNDEKISYKLPDLRFWDTREQVIAFEKENGNELIQEDPDLSFLKFNNKNEKVESVGYILGQAIQMFMKTEALKSDEFNKFLLENGFVADGEVKNSIQRYKSEKWSTVKPYSILEDIDLGDGNVMRSGMCFVVIAPTLKMIPYPVLDWSVTPQTLGQKEEAMGYAFLSKNTLKSGKILYTYAKKKEKLEFSELFSHRYLFNGDKLILASLLISPEAYVMNSMGDGFYVNPDFESLVKKEGFTTKQIIVENKGKENQVTIYSHEGKNTKFSLNKWQINLNGFSGVRAASLDFVPFDGPDIIEYEL